MNKLQKITLLSLCTFSVFSIGVGALTHSNNYDRVKVSANDTELNYYVKDMVYIRDIPRLDCDDYIYDTLIGEYQYDSDDYKLRYLYIHLENENALEYTFFYENIDYVPFRISKLQYDSTNHRYDLWCESIEGDLDYYSFGDNDLIDYIEIGYNDNVVYDGYFNSIVTSEMYTLHDFNNLLYECAPIYDTNEGQEYYLELQYEYNDLDYNLIEIRNTYVYIGGYSSSNYEYAPNGRYYVKYYNFDIENDDFNDLYNILPTEIQINYILQNEYDILMSFSNHKEVYLSAWCLSSYTFANIDISNSGLADTKTLTLYNHYYLDGTFYNCIELTLKNLPNYQRLKTVYLKNTTVNIDRCILDIYAVGNPNDVVEYSYDIKYTGTIKLVDDYKVYYKEMLSVFGLFGLGGGSFIGGVSSGNNNFFDTFGSAFNSVANFLSIEIIPNLSLWILLLVPFFVTLLIFIVKLFKR